MSKKSSEPARPPAAPEACTEAGIACPPDRWLFVNLFLCGLSTIAVEVAAFRLLAPYFGSTQFITTNVLGVVLAALAAGYWIGGKLADRRPTTDRLYVVTLLGGIGLALLPLVASPVLRAAAPAVGSQNASLFVGTLAAMVVLFAVPLFLLGMVSPFTIRLLSQGDARAGSRSGAVFALSTLGSIAGAYLPSLVTIPWLGTRGTIYAAAGTVLAGAAIGLLRTRHGVGGAAGIALAIASMCALAFPAPLKGGPNVLAEVETEVHLARVLRDERNKRNYLELNEGLSFHSVWYDDGRLAPGVWGFVQCLPPILATRKRAAGESKPSLRICIIGLAAGTVATQIQRAYGDRFDVRIDGVEIDEALVDLGRRYFALDERRLRVFIEDGRTFLARSTEKYDLILGDAYRQPYIPSHLVTREFFELAKARLRPGGIVSINAGALGTESPVLRGIQNALLAAFAGESVERFEVRNDDVPFSNYLCMASQRSIREAWASVQEPELTYFRDTALRSWATLAPDAAAPTFTDDRSPVEWYTDLSLVEFLNR